jgi:hypothetical protein
MEVRETDTLRRLTEFIKVERDRYGDRGGNMFAQTFSRITKTYRYLLIIEDRYISASEAFMQNTSALQATIIEGNHPCTPEQQVLHDQGWKLGLAVELEIDSFYVFAKMLLDRIAHGIEFYFGQAKGCSLESHKEMMKCFPDYVLAKKLKEPSNRLKERIEALKTEIRDYRDHEIVHAKKPRVLEGIGFDKSGSVYKTQGIMSPSEKDKFVSSKSPKDLMVLLDEYICLIIEFMRENATQARIEHQPSQSP